MARARREGKAEGILGFQTTPPPSHPVASGCDSAQGAPRDWRRQPYIGHRKQVTEVANSNPAKNLKFGKSRHIAQPPPAGEDVADLGPGELRNPVRKGLQKSCVPCKRDSKGFAQDLRNTFARIAQ
ncbi:uncharacterized protein PGTG_04811 [Puccinia graminis f. sp. tritici CRL 75-36-700-3]|uniref:Uncharacterized protein n=1 Tax=Puccinia graminis f. sp. tritici (strain CRL 75-36-700-3 / race SCCL) TaxID=418459 RepID=E3K453_PUCGT|nr:uncharacterized protein PGTG_04811 [Puccinia graminis f. sp. tritici CRL 75-36-700-3]EFP78855.2 hypothetical protein PGTG_04811 [Puccinia graminis f. sp. tritici CRL 75-36-700-3]